MKSWKRRVMVRTKEGFEVKAWQNAKTGEVTPTNWKIAAGHLAGPVIVTTRMANRRKRRAAERREGLLAFRRAQKQVFSGVDMAMPGADRSVTVHA